MAQTIRIKQQKNQKKMEQIGNEKEGDTLQESDKPSEESPQRYGNI